MSSLAFRSFLLIAALLFGLGPPPLGAQSPNVKITSFHPAEASYLGKTPFEIRGKGFTPSTRVIIDTASVPTTFVDATKLTGIIPPHSPTTGAVSVGVDAGNAGRDVLQGAVTYIGPLKISSVKPASLRAGAGGQVVITGVGFTPQTSVTIGSTVVPGQDRTFLDARTIKVKAPPLAAGRYNVSVAEAAILGPTIKSTLEGALTYTRDVYPGPQQVETSLAEGTGRFSWYNPIAYQGIEVLDLNGAVIKRLPGTATSLDLPAGNAERIDIKLRGVVGTDANSQVTDAIAKYLFCNPQPLAGNAQPGVLDLSLRGGHEPADVVRCAPDGAGAQGGGAHAGPHTGIEDLGRFGTYQRPGSTGRIRMNWQLDLSPDANSLVTGFVLEEDATVLDIAGVYEKVATFPGLELRGRITQVASPSDPTLEDGFTDELTFPSTTLAGKKQRHSVTYFRADKDVGYIPDPDDPTDEPAKPCLDDQGEVRTIPAGEYLLELYAVGGKPTEQYFTFADDSRDYELLIRNAPCPPYPMVTVTDMTGRYTLPVLTKIESDTLSAQNDKPVVQVQAFGSWLDETAMVNEVGPGFDDNPDFEYVWTIYDRGGNPSIVSSGSASNITTTFQDWGCYYIDVTVKDRACPRSRTQSFQIAVTPDPVKCSQFNPYFSFLHVTPEPSGICGIVGLSDPSPGKGKMENARPLEFRVLVAPKYYCQGLDGPAVFIGDGSDPDVEFTLATYNSQRVLTPIPGVDVTVTDLCPDVAVGLKYLHVRVEDLGALPNIQGADDGVFASVNFVGRSRWYYNPQTDARIDVNPNDGWRRIAPALRLTNHPPVLEESYWSGVYDEKADTYYFSMQAGPGSRQHFPIGESKEVTLPIPSPQPIEIPSYDNDMTSGFNARFKMHQEKFEATDGVGGAFGEAFGNQVEGAAYTLKPTTSGGGASLPGSGAGGNFPTYEWDDCRTIFSNELSETLFESILYTGTIGPVPVTVWASIGLGIDFLMQARTTVQLNPFSLIPGAGGDYFFKSDAALYSRVDVSLPCEIRADVLFGVASLAARLIPEATVTLKAHAGIKDTSPALGALMRASLSLYFEIEACIWALVDEICYSPGRVPILEDETLIEFSFGDGAPNISECEPGSGGSLAPEEDVAGHGGLVDPTFRLASTSRPGVAVSPGGQTTMFAVAVEVPEGTFDGARTLGTFFIEGQGVFQVENAIHDGIDPAVAFLSNSAAMIAWTRGGVPDGVIPVFEEIDVRNYIAAHQDVMVTVHRSASAWDHDGEVLVSDRPGEVSPSQKRADGMAAISADQSAAAQQSGGEAMVAWVRYDGAFLVEDATRTRIYEQDPNSSRPLFKARDVDTIRTNLEHTAIYARRMGPAGPLSAAVKISPAGVGINIEPTISVSPSGSTAYCVWVHDSSTDPVTGKQHVNLVDSNLGRSFLYSTYTKSTGAWTAPQVIATIPSADHPGMLEPSIALKANHDGLLAFTSLRPGSPVKDSGLANSRHVFTCRLENGAFGEPVLIHGKCLSPELGHWPQVAWAAPVQIFDVGGSTKVNVNSADFVVTYLGTGPAGSRSGAGNVMAAALAGDKWTAPRSLTKDENVHSNVIAAVSATGGLKTLNFNGGPARVIPGSGGGAGLASHERSIQTLSTSLEPDAAIVACRLSEAFAAPGSKVVASVEIENLGLAGTPVNQTGKSTLGVQAVFVDDSGRERKVTGDLVPVLSPGEKAMVDLTIEVPHEPVRLRVVLDPNLVDMDMSNNERECNLGAPSPVDLVCHYEFQVRDAEDDVVTERPVARLSWTNPALYDEVRVYRDGSMLTALSGDATLFADTYTAPGPHTYEVRGVIGVSKSRREGCQVELPQSPPEGEFRRGDVDDSGALSITDPIALLGYLFLGADEPACFDAADADDDGKLLITDPIRILGYLFLGSAPPPAPGPSACGTDPVADALPECTGACK